MMKAHLSLLLVTALIAVGACATDGSSSADSVWHETKQGTKKVTREVVHATRDGTKAVGQAAREVTREIGHASRDGAEAVGEGAREATDALREAFE
ncbi:MAG: hypothetical protein II007_04210 [Gammaproteobacteria bacterium]|nr:hypothetical protein [Gammaproteobacteria bacterium]